jgi:D-alanyl-D-alanine dipeptidase
MYRATCDRLRAAHPDWSEDRLRREVDRFSAPTDPAAPPPHTTGAAVDVHLVDDRGKVIDMISPYDLMDMRAAPRDAEGLTEQARANRLLLRAAMEGAGLTNYPAEWWHWTFGDQSWAYRGGHPEARYGAVVPPGYVDAPVDFSVHPDPGL